MSDVRERLTREIAAAALREQGWWYVADAILERFDVTVKPEPPVISDEELGRMVDRSSAAWVGFAPKGCELRERLSIAGLEIVRKAETE